MILNIKSLILTRPPLVLFVICLMLTAATIFSFIYYVDHEDKIVKNDALKDWFNLQEFLNKQHLCENSTKIDPNPGEEATITSKIIINRNKFPKTKQTILAYYDLSAWTPTCPDTSPPNATILKVQFNLGPNDVTCALITAPKAFLPIYMKQTCNFTPETGEAGVYTSKACAGSGIRTQFVANSDDFGIFLNDSDKNAIFVHLMWFGCFFLFSIIVALVWAVCHHESSPKNAFI